MKLSNDIMPAPTQALEADGLTACSARLSACDMVSTDEAAAPALASWVMVNAWIDKGRCTWPTRTMQGHLVAAWQFEPAF